DPDIVAYQAIIERERAKYWEKARALLLRGVDFTLVDIYQAVHVGDLSVDFAAYWKRTIDLRFRKHYIKETTWRTHHISRKWFLKYTRKKKIPISAIDSAWMEEYQLYLTGKMAYANIWTLIKD